MIKQIHHSTAKMILYNHAYWDKSFSVKETYKRIKNGENLLLNTGAKMFSDKGKIFISGYAMDNSDITELYKKDPLRKKQSCWNETCHIWPVDDY